MKGFYEDRQDRVADLRKLALEGLTAGKIAKAQGTTRNTVVNGAEKLGIAIAGLAQPRDRPRPVVAPGEPPAPPRVAMPKEEAPGPTARPLADLEPNQCKWPVGSHDPGSDRLLCGLERDGERPYCKRHAKRSGAPPTPHRVRATERLVGHLERTNR